ncbi:MAG TPA: hypothetical protein VIP48_05980 [Streptosporangiaceae bacterium]
MESGSDEQLAHLRRLADELGQHGLAAELDGGTHPGSLRAVNPEIPGLTERVLCAQAGDGSWWYWWPWGQPIGPVRDMAQAVAKIAAVLRSAQGRS